jgi:hypothetical protein
MNLGSTINGRRMVANRSKLRELTPAQSAALKRWLLKDGISYQAARARMVKKFGIALSPATLSRLWSRLVRPGKPASVSSRQPIFELEIESAAPVRVRVLASQARLKFRPMRAQRIRRNAEDRTLMIFPFKPLRKK